ncbi:DUF4143 domain-containing protein [Membranihabitans marinus]|nr:DUF4143 domain-containing protein [Membranihabitans marinus]
MTDDLKYFQLMRFIAGQIGEQLNVNSLSRQLKLPYRKAENMIYVARKSFMIATLPPFFRNFRKEITKMEKVFILDPGLRNFLINDFRPITDRQDKGSVLENYFFRILWERHNSLNLHYWRTADKYEVDFIVEESRSRGMAYEVKWNGEAPLKQGQIVFTEEYPDFPITKVCWDHPGDGAVDILRFHG